MSATYKPEVFRTHAILVLESIWPSREDYRGDGSNLVFTDSSENTELLKFSPLQAKYQGYYKIIPLNLLNTNISLSKESNSFSATFTANQLLFLTDGALPLSLKTILEKNGTRLKGFDLATFPFLEKILSGTHSFLNGYIVNYNVISQFVREMDVVSIYLVNIPEYLSYETLPIFIGQNPGRTKELELASLQSGAVRKLTNLGIAKSELNLIDAALKTKDLKNLLFYFRKISFGLILQRYFKATNIQIFNFNKEIQQKVYENEKAQIVEDGIESFINRFGRKIFDYYFKNKNNRKKAISCIENFYKHGGNIKDAISWSAFETLRLTLNELLGVSPGLCFERSTKVEEDKKFKAIFNSILTENYLFIYSVNALSSFNLEEITQAISFTNKQIGKNIFSVESYILGVNSALRILIDQYKNIFLNNETYSLDEAIKIASNISGDGLSLVFRGHITEISRNFSLRGDSGEITITLRGKGLSYPLEKHEIYADYTSIKFASQPLENFSVQVLTPLEAVIKILDSFAPYKIRLLETDRETFLTSVITYRGFDTYFNVGSAPNILVSQGNVVAPSYDANYEDLVIFTPLHYINKDLLFKIKTAFDEEAIAQKFLANTNQDVPNTSVFDALRKLISANSSYKIYTDHFGYLKIEFEPSNISFPFSLLLNEPVTDYNTFSLEHSSSESNVTTFLEVVPTSFGVVAPSNMGIASLYGRSIAPSISEMYSSVEYIDSSSDKFIDFLKEFVNIINKKLKLGIGTKGESEATKEIVKKLKSLNSYINTQDQDTILKYFLNEKNKKQVTQEYQAYEINVVENRTTDFCTNQVIVDKEIKFSAPKTVKITSQEYLPYNLFKPEELSYLFNVGNIRSEFLVEIKDFSYYKVFSNQFISFNPYYVDLNVVLKEICPHINSLAQRYFNLSKTSTICFKENIDQVAPLFVLGNRLNSYGKTSNRPSFENIITNIVNTIRIKSSESILKISSQLYDRKEGTALLSYFKDYYYYTIPYTDFSNTLTKSNIFLQNVSPDFFIYGLRRKSFQDMFISVYDAVKNQDRISAKRAELIRKLNSKPINTAKATVVGNNYFLGFTTLVINENLPPLNDAYISNKTLEDLSDDAPYIKDSENLLIYINEIIYDEDFKRVYKNLLPQIPGYYPPPNINEEVIINYYRTAIRYLLSFGFNFVPYQFFVPLFGVYTEQSLNNPFLGDYMKIILTEMSMSLPNKTKEVNYKDLFANFIIKNYQNMSTYQKYIVPQNYLVAQGHIENITHSWSVGSIYTTTLGINYLMPAIYLYLPNGKEKIILSYLVLDSPLSKFNESGAYNKFLNDESFFKFFRILKREYFNFYKHSLGLIDKKVKLKIFDIKQKLNI